MAPGDHSEIDRDRLATLRDLGSPDGDDFVADLVATFVADAARHLEAVRSALTAGNAVALAEAAHTLKGCCANLGATAMAATAHQLEQIGRTGSLHGATALAAELEACFSRSRAVLLEEARGRKSPSAE